MGNTMKAVIISILFLFLFHANFTFAEEKNPKNYLVFKGGMYFPQHDDLKEYSDGFNGEFYYGAYLGKHFSSEIGVGYFKSDGKSKISGTVSGVPLTFSTEDTLKVFDILYNIKLIYPIGKLELFAGPGIGIYFAKVNTVVTGTQGPTSVSAACEAVGDWNTAFGYHLLAGGNYNINANWFIGVEGKYFWAKTKDPIIPLSGSPFSTPGCPNITLIPDSGNPESITVGGPFGSHLDGVTATASFGWRF